MKHTPPPDTHFFASSVATWMTTTPSRSLRSMIRLMEQEGNTFNLFFVPAPYDADYEINMYQPQVEGAVWLGSFTKGESK